EADAAAEAEATTADADTSAMTRPDADAPSHEDGGALPRTGSGETGLVLLVAVLVAGIGIVAYRRSPGRGPRCGRVSGSAAPPGRRTGRAHGSPGATAGPAARAAGLDRPAGPRRGR